MTNQASELFELCKEVYKRTDWVATRDWIREDGLLVDYNVWATSTPLYTSDYLLEKLPRSIINDSDDWTDDTFWLTLTAGVDNWHAYYELANHKERHWGLVADTPLKALLKLTIALSEAGELNG